MNKIPVLRAKELIKEYPDVNDFISKHLIHFMVHGECDDNSISLADFYYKCEETLNKVNKLKLRL